MRARHQAGRAAQTTGGDNDVRGAKEARTRAPCTSRCELLTASTSSDPVPKPLVLSIYWHWLSLFTVVEQIWPWHIYV
jgi:hypothetical protein